jgi:hypothetical protein
VRPVTENWRALKRVPTASETSRELDSEGYSGQRKGLDIDGLAVSEIRKNLADISGQKLWVDRLGAHGDCYPNFASRSLWKPLQQRHQKLMATLLLGAALVLLSRIVPSVRLLDVCPVRHPNVLHCAAGFGREPQRI